VSDYDYTAPSADSLDDFALPSYAPTQSADDIERENAWHDLPIGDGELTVQDVLIGNNDLYKVLLDGQLTSYQTRQITLIFSAASNDRARGRDWFILPPGNPEWIRAYNEGVVPPKPGDKPRDDDREPQKGFASKKYFHFIHRLGITSP